MSTTNFLKPRRYNIQTYLIKGVEAAGPTMAGYLIERQVQVSSKRGSRRSEREHHFLQADFLPAITIVTPPPQNTHTQTPYYLTHPTIPLDIHTPRSPN